MRASFVKIRVDNSDGTYCQIEETMPDYVAQFLTRRLVMWESEWLMTSKQHFAYQSEHSKLTDLMRKKLGEELRKEGEKQTSDPPRKSGL